VAVANLSSQAANINVVLRDDTGAQIGSPLPIALISNQHKSFVLSSQFPATAGKRGTIEFDTPPGGQISVLGIRFTPPNNALTTIPALANVGTGGRALRTWLRAATAGKLPLSWLTPEPLQRQPRSVSSTIRRVSLCPCIPRNWRPEPVSSL
jgi:hypothetical protein